MTGLAYTSVPIVVGQAADRPWQQVDLTPVLAGTWTPPQPTVGQRSDGVGLFYPAKVHTISSESEAGKTWLALSAVADEINRGRHVAYLDFEDDEGSVGNRLLTLGLQRDAIGDRFHYLRPTEPLGGGLHLDDLRDVITSFRPSLAIIDGITEAMTLHGLDPLNNKDVATFGRILPRRIASAGPAVACLDHVVKDREGRGRYALGGVHKLNGLDGAAYLLENRTPLGIGLTGRSTIRIAKDRPGQLRRHGLPSSGGLWWFGDLILDSHDESFADISVAVPESKPASDFRPTHLMAAIAKVLAEHEALSKHKIEALVTGRAASIRQALALLQVDGYVSDATPHHMLKPYLAEVKE